MRSARSRVAIAAGYSPPHRLRPALLHQRGRRGAQMKFFLAAAEAAAVVGTGSGTGCCGVGTPGRAAGCRTAASVAVVAPTNTAARTMTDTQ